MIAALLLSYTSIFSQTPQKEYRALIDSSYSLLKSDKALAVSVATKAFNVARESDDEHLKTLAYTGIGYVSYKVRDYDAAFLNYSEALRRLELLDTTDLHVEVATLQHLGMIHSKFNNHDQSIEYRKRSLSVMQEYASKFPEQAEERKMMRLLKDIPYYLATEYEKKGSHQTAGKILMDLWAKAEDQNDIPSHARILNKLGLIKKRNGEFDEAIEYFGLVATESEVSDYDRAIAYHNLGDAYMVQGELERAESNYLLAQDLKRTVGSDRSKFITYLSLGELEYKKNNMEASIAHFEKGLSVFNKVEGEPELYEVYNWLQLAYMGIDVDKAKSFNEEFKKLNDFYVKNQTFQREGAKKGSPECLD